MGLLGDFNAAGVLDAADVHVAERLASGPPAGGDDELVQLGLAFAVRAPRLGHVCTDLATIAATASSESEDAVDLTALPWPAPDELIAALAASPLVALDEGGPDDRPARLVGTRLYLDRYWREERAVASALLERAEGPHPEVDEAVLDEGLTRLFGAADAGAPDLQRLASGTAVRRRLAVIAGGPGTGKTTTVARVLALLVEQATADGRRPPRIALAAPTGKAAARLEESVHATAEDEGLDVTDAVRAHLRATGASTLHRLLGWRPDSRSRFRHDATNRLPHDVVVVDETSMISLTLMARLVLAVRPGARLLLVGDPEQLASVEAGSVLGDVVGPPRVHAHEPADRGVPSRVRTAEPGRNTSPSTHARPDIAGSIVVLREVHRYGPALAELAEAIQRGDEDGAVAVLRAGSEHVRFVDVDLAETRPSAAALAAVRDPVVAAAREVVRAAQAGEGGPALEALTRIRVLCAHRRGDYGAQTWRAHIEGWLTAAVPGYGAGGDWYVGRPLLVTANDYGLGLHNGDTGVMVARPDGRAMAVFERRGELVEVAPSRLGAVETVHAMTVHKSQGSQLDEVAVLLPAPSSPILTRELIYTAVTRARERVTVVGTEAAVRAAVRRPIARASGLREALWGSGG
jgi:exodeoxyribonuclease V alpha subunit